MCTVKSLDIKEQHMQSNKKNRILTQHKRRYCQTCTHLYLHIPKIFVECREKDKYVSIRKIMIFLKQPKSIRQKKFTVKVEMNTRIVQPLEQKFTTQTRKAIQSQCTTKLCIKNKKEKKKTKNTIF